MKSKKFIPICVATVAALMGIYLVSPQPLPGNDNIIRALMVVVIYIGTVALVII